MIQNNLQFRGHNHGRPKSVFKAAPGSITTWDELVGKFLQKFFPISKTVQLRREITTFKQKIGTGIPSNRDNNPLREGMEHVKAIVLHLGKV
ncbi:NADH--cytochrome b5 reductase 1-like [Gossypium australe]|uniref:NADH--cytochrome b5 reductase 1-like n=1 Tax=Gossypium australe TaxID=47621 RepID=A0A5B6UY02_9ROSI|nr:NADH--cytochrome b5 reductase 1-like [Gossypium australe]